MGQISDVVKIDRAIEYALVIKVSTTAAEFSDLLQDCRKKIRDHLKELKVIPSGVSFVGFYHWEPTRIEAVIGYPVKDPILALAPIELFTIPSGQRAFVFYQGAYDNMSATYHNLETWVNDHGYEVVLPAYEYFYNSPKYPQELLLTKIEMIIT